MKLTTVKMRLVVTIMVTTLLSLSVACLIYSFYDLSRYRAAKKRELTQLVALISPLLVKRLKSPNDRSLLWKELVSQNKSIQTIVLYRRNFTALDEYVSTSGRAHPLSPEKGVEIIFSGDFCQFFSPITDHQRNTVGYVAVDYALRDRVYGFRSVLLVFGVIFVFSILLTYIISSLLQARLLKAVCSLVDVAKSIYVDKDYTARAIKQTDDEFGLLADGLNAMLDEVNQREAERENLNEHLESRVETRTAALQEINFQLRNEKKRADQAYSIKSNFLANMSHEIRTPLNGIIASCDLAVSEDLSPKVANYLKIIQSSSHTLLLVINDILDFSKLEEGTLELEKAPFSLSEMMCTLGEVFKEQAIHKKIGLTLDVESSTPDILVGDRERLQQILMNLLDNSLKFTSEGEVALHIGCIEKKDDAVIIECKVSDTGVGLTEDGQSAIFQSFHQVDSSSTRKFGGAGLGLAITKKLAIMMGGTIEVESRLGHGSTFTVTVRFGWKHSPLSIVEKEAHQALPLPCTADDLAGKHVLLAEDNETNRDIAEALLTGFGLTVDSVVNGEFALQALTETEYDVVILDVEMPVLSGSATMKRIRAKDEYKDLPIIAMNSHPSAGEKEKYLQDGANAFLGKPISPDRVKDVLCRVFEREYSAPETTVLQPPRSVVLDPLGASRKLGVELEVYYKVLTTFYVDYDGVRAGFNQAVDTGDLDWLTKKIHSLKGSSGTIGAEQLTALSTSLDLLCKSGQIPNKEQIDNLLAELDQVRAVAKEFVSENEETTHEDDGLQIIDDAGLRGCFRALAKALDESLYDQINNEIKNIEKKISGSKVGNLGKVIRMYAYDDALVLLHEIATELAINFDDVS